MAWQSLASPSKLSRPSYAPPTPNRLRTYEVQDWCDTTLLQGDFDAFEKTFNEEPGFREHSIIYHPEFQPFNKTQWIHIVTKQGKQEETGYLNVIPGDKHCGLTEDELKAAVAPYADVPILWFSSLYHRFKGATDWCLENSTTGPVCHFVSRTIWRMRVVVSKPRAHFTLLRVFFVVPGNICTCTLATLMP